MSVAEARDFIRDYAIKHASPALSRSIAAHPEIPLRQIYDLCLRSACVTTEDRIALKAAGAVLAEVSEVLGKQW